MGPVAAGFHHPLVRAARALHQKKHRQERRRFLIEGDTLVNAALDAGLRLECGFFASEAGDKIDATAQRMLGAGVTTFHVDSRTIAALCQTRAPQGIAAVACFLHVSAERLLDVLPPIAPVVIAVLDHISDPGNAGTLVRSAEAFGLGAVCFGSLSVEPYNDKLVRAAMGALFRVPVVCYDTWDEFKTQSERAGLAIVAAQAGAPDVRSITLPKRAALLIGHERRGLAGLRDRDIELRVGIPQSPSVESLNAAVAGSIVMYEAARSAGILPARKI